MKQRFFHRLLCGLLAVCLLPVAALAAEGDIPLDQPITYTDFTIRLGMDASAFPQSNSRLTDWQGFLDRLSLTGTAVTMDLLGPLNRVHLLGDLQLDGRTVLPFQHEQYCNYFYLQSPVLDNDIIHFQMDNFFNFMLKPYFFMGLGTQYLGLLLYPHATAFMARSYYEPLAEACAGTGERVVSYDTLYDVCLKLDELMTDDWNARVYGYIRALLIDVGGDEMTAEGLSSLETYLDFLDPEQAGLTIQERGNKTTYQMGGRTLLTVKRGGEAFSVSLALPHPDGYALNVDVDWTPTLDGATLATRLHILSGTDDALLMEITGEGLPCSGNLEGEGAVTVAMSGYMVGGETVPTTLRCTWYAGANELPQQLHFTVGYLHPETGKEALTLYFTGALREGAKEEIDVFTRPREDFFTLNTDKLEEYKSKYMRNIALTLAPLALQMPAGVLDSVVEFLVETDILNAFGIDY